MTPSDWQAQHLHKPNNPLTVRDWKAATKPKQGKTADGGRSGPDLCDIPPSCACISQRGPENNLTSGSIEPSLSRIVFARLGGV